MFFFFPLFSFFPLYHAPSFSFHFFDDKWLALLIITEKIAAASFTNGQSVAVCVGVVKCTARTSRTSLAQVRRQILAVLVELFPFLRLDHDVPFPARQYGPSAFARTLPSLLGPSWCGVAGLSGSGNGGCPKASS